MEPKPPIDETSPLYRSPEEPWNMDEGGEMKPEPYGCEAGHHYCPSCDRSIDVSDLRAELQAARDENKRLKKTLNESDNYASFERLQQQLQAARDRNTEYEIRLRAADIVMERLDVLIARGDIDARNAVADARLDYGEPFKYEAKENEQLQERMNHWIPIVTEQIATAQEQLREKDKLLETAYAEHEVSDQLLAASQREVARLVGEKTQISRERMELQREVARLQEIEADNRIRLDDRQQRLDALHNEYQDLKHLHSATLNAYGSCQEALEELQGEKNASTPEEIPLQD